MEDKDTGKAEGGLANDLKLMNLVVSNVDEDVEKEPTVEPCDEDENDQCVTGGEPAAPGGESRRELGLEEIHIQLEDRQTPKHDVPCKKVSRSAAYKLT